MFCTFSFQVLPESQPLTPISTSTPDHGDARTPQSVRSLDSEPSSLVVPPVINVTPTPVKGNQRKRKMDRASINQTTGATHSSRNHSTTPVGDDMTPLGLSMEAPSTNTQPSPCAKRQIIVQNEVMDGSHTNSHGNHVGPVTPASVSHESGSSPHHSSIEADNSGDSARWRKVSHQSHWESTVSILGFRCRIQSATCSNRQQFNVCFSTFFQSGSSSVKDLEQVMSKHLPGRDAEHGSSIASSGIDFSADSLLRQQPGSRTGSAIQWVGPGAQSGPGLPVSALLRQLCASRESVIRANVQVRSGTITTIFTTIV